MSLAFAHGRILFLETIRIPIALLFNVAFPALLMVFFVLPNERIASEPAAATAATIQLTVFAVLSACLLNFGVGVAEERSRSWDTYLRALPTGPVPRMIGRVLNGLAFAVLAVIPVVVVAPILTEATVPLGRLVLAVSVLMLASVPFLFGGFALGYAMSVRSAMPAAQAVMFPMAFAGGLFFPPEMFPSWVDRISVLLPTRSIRELVLDVAADTGNVSLWTVPVLLAWTAIAAWLAVVAYRRDEGARYT